MTSNLISKEKSLFITAKGNLSCLLQSIEGLSPREIKNVSRFALSKLDLEASLSRTVKQ